MTAFLKQVAVKLAGEINQDQTHLSAFKGRFFIFYSGDFDKPTHC